MAELLVMVAQVSPHPDAGITAMQFHQGDVITIQEDGYPWSAGDLAGHATVIKLPGLLVSDLIQLTGSTVTQANSLGQVPPNDTLLPSTDLPQLRLWNLIDWTTPIRPNENANAQAFIASRCKQKPPQAKGP